MQTRHLQMLLPWVPLIAAGCAPGLDFGGDTESKTLTYTEYVADGGDSWFDPVGASNIYHRCFSTRDGYDAWWRFIIAEDDGDKLLRAVAGANDGPTNVGWNETTDYPNTWYPDDSPPTWWSPSTSARAKSIHWCYDAGSAKRHHGWYFLYDPESKTMYCWHWNHQWSSAECSEANAR